MTPSTPDITVYRTLGDESEEEHVIVVHCFFNMNTRAPGISVWKGAVLPIYNVLEQARYRVHQFPCLETAFTGSRRWWYVKEQYDNLLFREMCYRTALIFAKHLLHEGVRKIKILGAGLSPTCGYRETQSDPSWGGMPRPIDTTKNVKIGRGVFFEQAPKALDDVGLEYEILDVSPAILYPGNRVEATTSYPKDPLESVFEVCRFLEIPCNHGVSEERLRAIKDMTEDRRSLKNLVVPREVYVEDNASIRKYVEDGYGIVIIEDMKVGGEDRDYILNIYRLQLGNQILAGHKVVFYAKSTENSLYNHLADRIRREFESGAEFLQH